MLRNAAVFDGFYTHFEKERRLQPGMQMAKVYPEHERQRNTKQICCPACGIQTHASRCKRWSTQHFSNLKCLECSEISSTKEWRCTCGLLWYKCPLHFMPSQSRTRGQPHKVNMREQRRKRLILRFGTSKPMPRHRFPRGTSAREEAFHVYAHDEPGHNSLSHYSGRADQRASTGGSEADQHATPLRCV